MQQLKILFFLCLIHTVSFAQKDTSGKQTVEIISSFKPALLKSAKIYFSGIQLSSDTEKITRPYSIPSQNLFYTYRSISIKPLALQIDPSPSLGVLNYIKAGYGNYATPYFNGSVGWGDGKTSLVNIYADYISSKGKIANQDYDNLSIKGEGSYFLPKQELYAAAGLRKRNYFLYGYNHDSLQFDKSAVKQSFQLIDFNLGMRNIVDIQQGFSYNPSLKVDLFTSKNQLSENSFLLSLPLQKKWREAFFLTFAATLDFTQYATKQLLPENLNLTNRVVQLSPAVKFQSNQISIKAGVSPAWDNMDFVLLPDISVIILLKFLT